MKIDPHTVDITFDETEDFKPFRSEFGVTPPCRKHYVFPFSEWCNGGMATDETVWFFARTCYILQRLWLQATVKCSYHNSPKRTSLRPRWMQWLSNSLSWKTHCSKNTFHIPFLLGDRALDDSFFWHFCYALLWRADHRSQPTRALDKILTHH